MNNTSLITVKSALLSLGFIAGLAATGFATEVKITLKFVSAYDQTEISLEGTAFIAPELNGRPLTGQTITIRGADYSLRPYIINKGNEVFFPTPTTQSLKKMDGKAPVFIFAGSPSFRITKDKVQLVDVIYKVYDVDPKTGGIILKDPDLEPIGLNEEEDPFNLLR